MIQVFGIRHHGPGSARSLLAALEALAPDIVLVEGPPDADELIAWAAHPGLQPPIALLVYNPQNLRQAAFVPFAIFSPEWQALQYSLGHSIPARFIDLPMRCQFALTEQAGNRANEPGGPGEASAGEEKAPGAAEEQGSNFAEDHCLYADPLAWIARSAGYSDGESWWDNQVEQRKDHGDVFAAILELMAALRSEVENNSAGRAELKTGIPPGEAVREAWMRRSVRQAQKDGFQRIAVVCGAWHAPALAELKRFPVKADEGRLKRLPQVKTAAAWIPWTYGRLTLQSGYSAGINAPHWYDHLWEMGELAGTTALCIAPKKVQRTGEMDQAAIVWLTKAAGLLRSEGLDASPSQVIETVRLAEALAALRDRPIPGLPELTEALQSVLCHGNLLPVELIRTKLMVGDRIGATPAEAPLTPLQGDLHALQKRLRLSPDPEPRDLDLDLRRPIDLERSRLLHRLLILKVGWGVEKQARGKLGNFHELWQMRWQPEFALPIVEAGRWGNTIAEAAAARAQWLGDELERLADLTALLGRTLLADLSMAIPALLACLENCAALSNDIDGMMDALLPLADVLRYGDVRGTDRAAVDRVAGRLIARICIGLPAAWAVLDDEAAGEAFQRLLAVNEAMIRMQNAEYSALWQAVLGKLADQAGLHGLLSGRAVRLLMDAHIFDLEQAARRLGLALSPANPPASAAAWLDGFLRGSGLLLVHDPALWSVIDGWVTSLSATQFCETLPLLRRIFAHFSTSERRLMGENLLPLSSLNQHSWDEFDERRAGGVLPRLSELLGIQPIFAEKFA